MFKPFLLLTAAGMLSLPLTAQWKPAGDKIRTTWGEQLRPDAVLPEYPRPLVQRTDWQNLNGLWNYAIQPVGSPMPAGFDGGNQILVPFAVESSLSGVGQRLGAENELWYQRRFTLSVPAKNKRILLHFGAVDWKTDVWVNQIKVGSHTGGYTPFSFDITQALTNGENTLTVKVWDPTDQGTQPRGKQVSRPGGIWYTPVSGIWQTVWIEPVPMHYIAAVKTTPDIDANLVRVAVQTAGQGQTTGRLRVCLFEGAKQVAEASALGGVEVEVPMPSDAKLWSPDTPFLYRMEISLIEGGKTLDRVRSYTAMRKYSMRPDADGILRLQLNNRNLFQFGPLDQGWWPDGLYTAPSDEALCYDIQKVKAFGFNMIRKHIKVEPARWYAHCDSIGLIVWQDMPSGDRNPEWQNHRYFEGTELTRSPQSEATYRKEWREIIDALYSYPCIGMWVPFNEAWGQFKTAEIAAWTKQYDPSRLVNPASGGNFYPCGDILDLHNYPEPKMYLYDASRANVLGEYGGIGLVLPGHLWEEGRNWGYVQRNNRDEATGQYAAYIRLLEQLVKRGFAAAVYTQLTDVEIEINGLLTYDRKVIKLDENTLRELNSRLCNGEI
ncbi:MAG: beta galactosidase jelly roll domain-containing protein [Prevotellaceae bacterium]|jgi:beta-galactosidase/beta-glucuronidase|nr:beta galactosidase jelly roll domain-containing protein [Prevotellaceae bacterium]